MNLGMFTNNLYSIVKTYGLLREPNAYSLTHGLHYLLSLIAAMMVLLWHDRLDSAQHL